LRHHARRVAAGTRTCAVCGHLAPDFARNHAVLSVWMPSRCLPVRRPDSVRGNRQEGLPRVAGGKPQKLRTSLGISEHVGAHPARMFPDVVGVLGTPDVVGVNCYAHAVPLHCRGYYCAPTPTRRVGNRVAYARTGTCTGYSSHPVCLMRLYANEKGTRATGPVRGLDPAETVGPEDPGGPFRRVRAAPIRRLSGRREHRPFSTRL
jgi:hypothetical protein